jgi:hypothetical protein
MEETMKRIIITAAVLLGTGLTAQAGPVASYHDLIRPHGHPRSDAIHEADLDFCYQQTGQSRYSLDGPAFKKCMLGRGYRFEWQRAGGSGGGSSGFDSSPSPDVPMTMAPVPDAPYVAPTAPTPDNPNCGGGLC